ncbi:hypothetical protein [Clostridium perfringens]|uniref:hypothetical protein n=1 Tax=Clostridium perfringens TaxID=1502 RepID=UPI000B375137|nr:hypothetical protein [Clostridium perfringens]MDM0699446.1 hypothetical protein [Clostridium perfringens]MDT9329641.1 hypothetical protein [Clostridium perfringens]MDT9332735.1 hypothetical protein [Clostridium perfringens]OUP41926.1 hypothetical protein B5F20_14220 [Clostridium perfringens]
MQEIKRDFDIIINNLEIKQARIKNIDDNKWRLTGCINDKEYFKFQTFYNVLGKVGITNVELKLEKFNIDDKINILNRSTRGIIYEEINDNGIINKYSGIEFDFEVIQ